MSDPTTITQVVQIGVEATAGTAVAATKLLQSMSIEPAIKAEVEIFTPTGYKYPTVAAEGKEWAEAKIAGRATFTEIIYPLSSVLAATTPTTVDTTVKKWTFSPSTNNTDTVKTFTVERGSRVRAHRFSYGSVTQFGLDFSRAGVPLSGAMLGQRLSDGIQMSTNEVQTLSISGSPTGGTFTLTFGGQTTATIAYNANAAAVQSALEALSNVDSGDVVCTGGALPGTAVVIEFRGQYRQTDVGAITANSAGLTGGSTPTASIAETTPGVAPSAIALVPVLGNQVDVYLADAYAGLAGASKLTRAISAGWAVNNRFGGVWTLNSSNASFAATVETQPAGTAKLRLAADATGMALLTTMRAGDTKFMRIKATGAVIGATTETYLLQIDVALKVKDVSEFSDEEGLFAIEWSFEWAHDATWGKATEVIIQNLIASL